MEHFWQNSVQQFHLLVTGKRILLRAHLRCFDCKFLNSVDINVSGFDQSVDDSLDCASNTVHRPLAMMGLVLVPLQYNILVEMSKQWMKLWPQTITPQNNLMQFAHPFFQLINDGDVQLNTAILEWSFDSLITAIRTLVRLSSPLSW